VIFKKARRITSLRRRRKRKVKWVSVLVIRIETATVKEEENTFSILFPPLQSWEELKQINLQSVFSVR